MAVGMEKAGVKENGPSAGLAVHFREGILQRLSAMRQATRAHVGRWG